MRSLNEYAKEKATFIQIGDGETYSGIYRGFKFVEKDSFGETKEYARYLIEDLEDHIKRTFDSMSGSLAKKMSKIPEGAGMSITRHGVGAKTTWDIKYEGQSAETVKQKGKEYTHIPVIEEENTDDAPIEESEEQPQMPEGWPNN